MLGGAAALPAQAFVLLLGIVGLTVLLLSDRFRTGLQSFVSRHFQRARHDFRKIWTEFTRRTANALDAGATPADLVGVLIAVAPQVGGPKVVAAAPELMVALGLSLPDDV